MDFSIPCSIKRLPAERQVAAAARAVEVNPVNAPATAALRQADPAAVDITPAPRRVDEQILGSQGSPIDGRIHGQSSRRSEGPHPVSYERRQLL